MTVSTDVELAVSRLRAGGVVAFPTETVYGLAADASSPTAVRRIFDIKGRPTDHPLIVHLGTADELTEWAERPSPATLALADACWPGPLTMLVRRTERAGDWVTGGRHTVGLRVPAHPVAQELLTRFHGGLAAPSANRFGRVSPTTSGHVIDDIGALLDPDLDLILEGGRSVVGVESTIVDTTTEPPQLLRSGAITADEIGRLIGTTVASATGPSRTSGMLASHYAPACRIVLVDVGDDAEQLARAHRRTGLRVGVLDRTDDLVVAARQLYSDLRAADDAGLDVLVTVLPLAAGIGWAIRDRLTKAAGCRPDATSPDG